MNILLAGGTGFIGSELRTRLLQQGHMLTVITRSPNKYENETAANQQFISWDSHLPAHMEQADVVINLAGESIFGQRWTEDIKRRIYSSRIDSTHTLVEAIEKAGGHRPGLLISASAVGYYGDRGNTLLDENEPPGDDFLSKVCIDWEKKALEAKKMGVRVAIPRLGIVLGTEGGALQQMLPPFKLFAGGPVGSGKQFFPWIHMHDLCRGLLYPIEREMFDGVYNLCSPDSVTMREFADTLGEVLGRPSFFRVPEFALNLVLGEAAGPIVNSLNVQPEKLQQSGFEFEFENLHEALSEIL